jgi:photosystem II stability/assembly factor-like uncharacterized protein
VRKFFLSAFVIVAMSPAMAQFKWGWLHPRPQANAIHYLKIWDAQNWYAGGDASTFMKTTDAGVTWAIQHDAGYPQLSTGTNQQNSNNTGWFFDQNIGILAGQGPGIMRTTNAGATWDSIRILTTTNTGSINSLYFLNASTGFLCGNTAYKLYKTTNGGLSWMQLPNVPQNTYTDVYALDENNIFMSVLTASGQLLHTSNGGATWETITTGVPNSINDIEFASPTTGYICGPLGGFAYSTNAGITWTPSPMPVTTPMQKLKVEGSEVYVVGDYTSIYKTTNNGASWDSLQFIAPTEVFSWIKYSIDKLDNTIVLGGAYGLLNKSTDFGANWSSLSYYITQANLWTVFAQQGSPNIWAAGDGLFYSNDGGRVWHTGETGTSYRIRSVRMVNADSGFYCGESAALGKTSDGGATWTPLTYPDQTKSLRAMDFTDRNTGWVTGGTDLPPSSTVAKTTDGGSTWTMQTLPFNDTPARTIDMVDENIGWVGASLRASRTSDGGATWLPVSMPPNTAFNSFKAFDFNTVIGANGGSSKVYKTTNGGATWDSLGIPDPSFRAAWTGTDWTDEMTGVVVGSSGITAKTTDGGQTWTTKYLGGNMTARAVMMIDPDTAFCVTGSGGFITGGQIFRYAGSGGGSLPLAGTYTVGTGGNFPTLDSAFSALRALGVSGPVTLSLTDTLFAAQDGPTRLSFLRSGALGRVDPSDPQFASSKPTRDVESQFGTMHPVSGALTLAGPIPGTSPSSRITIRPAANKAVRINSTGAWGINLLNASYVTIDGVSLAGTTRLTINTPSATVGGVVFEGNSDNNILQNTTIRSSAGGVHLVADSATATPDNNTVQDNAVPKALDGIVILGNATSFPTGNSIVRNQIGAATDTIGEAGIYVQQAFNTVVEGNYIQNIRQGATTYNLAGIWVATKHLNTRISNNVVRNVKVGASTTSAVFAAGMYIFGTATDTTNGNYCNNMIYDVDYQGTVTGGTVRGMYVSSGIRDSVAYNSIYLTGTAPTSITSGGLYTSTHLGQVFRNNVVINTRTEQGTGRAIAFYKLSTTSTISSNYNDLYVPTQALSYVGAVSATNYATLANWQATGQDSQSVNVMASFRSPDLHIDTTQATPLDAGAIPVAGITTDIDGQPRNLLIPDIGADEFSRTALIAPAISAITRNIRVPAAGDSVLVTARIVDSTGIGIVADSLWYSVNGIPPVAVAMPRISGTSTDGVYRGIIPRSTSVNGYRVEYQIAARGANTVRTFTPISAANSYFAGISPLSLTGLRSVGSSRQLLYKGYYAKVTGTVNGPNFQTTNLGYFFQDAVGGINLFKSGTISPVLSLGDSIIVTGKLDQFRGLTEITPDTATLGSDIVRVATGRPVAVSEITMAAFNSNPEFFEGHLIRLAGLLRRDATPPWPSAGNSANIVMYQTIGTDTIITRIDSDTEIPGSPEPAYPLTVVGVVGQFTSSTTVNNDGYQIQPRYLTDVASYQPNVGWTANTSGTTALLYSVKAVDQLVGWIAGGTFNSQATVLRTVNGGEGWASVGRPPVAGELYAVEALDANTAFVVSTVTGTSRIYRTTNAGTTWAAVFSQAGGFIDAIKMYDATNGIAIGDPVGGTFTILKTIDGGATWARIATEPIPLTGEAAVNNSLSTFGTNYIWFGSSVGNVYRSTNGGATWAFSSLGISNIVNELAFNGPLYGVAGSTSAFRTTDGGVTWTGVANGGSGDILGISAIGDNFWLAQGSNVYRSADRGATWAVSYSGTIGTLRHLDFTAVGTSARGWTVSTSGGIAAAWFTGVVNVKELKDLGIPTTYVLDQNYPNPFNPTTTIKFALPKESNVTLRIYNIVGQEVAHLVEENKPAGFFQAQWSGRNQDGTAVASGVYFYRMEAKPVAGGESFVSLKKMMLLK